MGIPHGLLDPFLKAATDGVVGFYETLWSSRSRGDNNHKLFDPQLSYSDHDFRTLVELRKRCHCTNNMTAQERREGTVRGFKEDLFQKMGSADAFFGGLPYQVLTSATHLVQGGPNLSNVRWQSKPPEVFLKVEPAMYPVPCLRISRMNV